MQRPVPKTYESEPPESPEKNKVRFPSERIYGNIDEAAKNCRKIFLIYLSFLSYALLTAVTTSSKQLILGENVVLPLIQTTVSSHIFFILTPFMAIGFLIYIQLYLLKINELIQYSIEECHKENKGKPECDEQVDPN